MKAANAFDVAVIVIYFVAMLAIGVYFVRRNRGGKDYFTGGNLIPWWMSGMTLYMANFSAWTFTAAAGIAYTTGWFTLLYFAVGPVSYFIGTQMTAAKWRRTRSVSPVEYTYARYNVTTQQIISWVVSVNFILSGGVQLASTCKILAPILGFDILTTVVVTGIIILLYSYLGGVWAVSTTDVVQGVILLGITLIIMPLAVSHAGGLGALARAVPPLSFDHTYNGVHYTEHWLVGILLISVIGYAGGQGQRFFSVVDERAAKRVGRFAAVLALTIPIVFGLPPLAARVLWPDLAQVPWFVANGGKNPQDLVFVAMCLKILPNGLIGVFVAAMLAATMSTLSAVYNMISSVYARDIHPTIVRRAADDAGLLRLGRYATLGIGLIVLGLAVLFVQSATGIFNLMQAFFTLFNIPVTVPLAFGLLNRRVPRWSAVGAVTWGLLTGACTRHVLAWDIGPQIYIQLLMTLGMYLASPLLARWHRERRALLYLLAAAAAVATTAAFIAGAPAPAGGWQALAAWRLAVTAACGLLLGSSTVFFARLFARDSEADRAELAAFFRKLDTPVDVEREVRSAGRHFVSTLPFIGGTVVFMGALMSLIFLTPLSAGERAVTGSIIAVLLATGAVIILAGLRVRRAELRAAAGQEK